jgi:hypothetical protein
MNILEHCFSEYGTCTTTGKPVTFFNDTRSEQKKAKYEKGKYF